ncbi:MAG: fumarylacetoacetate hydrolase family protein [Bryobacterales bacterium]|nr:fumarylacetoacetate hydrolase family protein [Bryobacterales bacterium]
MKLGQIRWNKEITAAVFDESGARPIPGYTMQGLIERSEKEGIDLGLLAARHAVSHTEQAPPIIPIHPREVWACGCTYEMSASFRDAEHGAREGFYAYVYREPRPEIFFKGTARVCVGLNKPIGIRSDSKFTAPEPELAVVLGSKGAILGFTAANDVSAWDIERENPLYLPQSKVYTACCALGPYIVTPDEFGNPYGKQVRCTIKRGGTLIFDGTANTSQLHRKLETLIEYLYRANPVPSGSVLCTGTGIIVKEDAALQPGDICSVSIEGIGELSNPVAVV